jgi:hypothetical protein
VLGDLAAEGGGAGGAEAVEVTKLRMAPFDSRKLLTFLACSSEAERVSSNGSLAKAPRICSAFLPGNILCKAVIKSSGEVPGLKPVNLIENFLASELAAL